MQILVDRIVSCHSEHIPQKRNKTEPHPTCQPTHPPLDRLGSNLICILTTFCVWLGVFFLELELDSGQWTVRGGWQQKA